MYDLIVIGGGVVGLAVLRAATLKGWSCVLVEREADLLSHASGSNSGIVCTGVDASPGTLERALIRDANSMFRLYCQEHNLPMRPCGSMVCQWPWDDENHATKQQHHGHERIDPPPADVIVLAESINAGDTHARRLNAKEAARMEPNLSRSCLGAVHIPGEIVVDPWLYSISLAIHAKENGARVETNFCVDPEACVFENGIWTIFSSTGRKRKLQAKAVVNAAGLWADVVQAKTQGKAMWQAKPRRGQYRIFQATHATRITHPIQPVPSQITKGIFVFSTLYDQIVVGPTALDQESRTDRSIDGQVAQQLDAVVRKILPSIDPQKSLIGEYVGIRPGSDQRDYQIHLLPKKNWVAVAAIRSTGLTASLGIGNYVVRQLQAILDPPSRSSAIRTTPLPDLRSLLEQFNPDDGTVNILGDQYRVTHPLTRLGWTARSGLASRYTSKL